MLRTRHPALSTDASEKIFCFVVLLLLMILGSIERIYGIDRQSLWSDELYAVMASYRPHFLDIWPLLVNDSHPPGYVALMYFILPLTGYSDIGIRLHALIYGILWIPLVFWLGKRWISCEAGLLAAAFITSAHSAIYFSQEARAYSMLVTFCLANLVCFLEILFARTLHRGYVTGFVVSATFILYLHYTGFVFIAAAGLLYLLFWIGGYRRGSWKTLAICFGIPLLLYAPWLGLMLNHLTDTSRHWAVSAVPSLADVYYSFQRLWGPDDGLTRIYLYSLVTAFLFAVYCHLRHGIRRLALVVYSLTFMLVIPVLAFYIESQLWTPIFEKRYFLVTLPLVTLLLAFLYHLLLSTLIAPAWHKIVTSLLILGVSIGMISSNIDKNFYTEKTKDPIREAVGIIKQDLEKNPDPDTYTIIMTFGWFEHYLRQMHISYDRGWEYRIYYAPQQIGNITGYLEHRPTVQYLYFLSLRDPNSDAATNVLKLRYRLVSKATLNVPSGAVDVYKFNTKQAPEHNNISTDKDKFNEVAQWLATDVQRKKPGSYTTLITHDWMEPYMSYHKISLDRGWSDRFFYRDTQLDDVDHYLQQHPAMTTLYYTWLESPGLELAATLLQLQYPLQSTHSMDTPLGTVHIYEYNLKGTPNFSTVPKTALEKQPAYLGTKHFADSILGRNPASYKILTSRNFISAYLRSNNVAIDQLWNEQHYFIDQQAESVFTYLNKHPKVTDIFYLFLKEEQTERAANILRTRYTLVSSDRFTSDHGVVEVYHLDTTRKPANLDSVKDALRGNPLFYTAKWAGQDAQKSPGQKYITLVTHDFFQPYLDLHQVAVNRSWNDRFVSHPNQVETILAYLKSHPDIHHAYYFAIADANTQASLDLLSQKSHISCQKVIKSANLGKVSITKFDIKDTPSRKAIPECAG